MTNGDNSNVLVARVARENFGVERVVARIYDPRRAVIYQRLGFATVATVAWTTDQVMRRLLPDPTDAEWTDPTAKVCIVERQVTKPWIGKPLSELEEATKTRVVAVGPARRPSCRRRTPSPRRATCSTCRSADARLADSTRRPRRASRRAGALMRVVIAGGGSVGRFIAEQLHDSGHDVTIIDNDRDVVAQAGGLGRAGGRDWFEGDACEIPALRTAGMAEADVVAAVTGDDEDNLVISLLAKQEFGVPRSSPG